MYFTGEQHAALNLTGSPIKRTSVKENASPGEEIIIVALLRYARVAYSPCQSLFFAFACIQVVSMDLSFSPSPHWSVAVTRDRYKASCLIIRSAVGSETWVKRRLDPTVDPTVSTVIEAEMVGPGLAGLWDNILKIR